jgi:hypothetical protein
MELERLGHEAEGARRLGLDPRKLLRRAQRGQLRLKTALGDVTAGDLGDSDHVVEDQRAERAAAVGALEQDPGGARAASVDAREPGAHGVRRAPADDRRGPLRRSRRDTALREPIQCPLRRPAHRAVGGAFGEPGQCRQSAGAVLVRERAQLVVEGSLGQAPERSRVEARGRVGHPKRSWKNGWAGWSTK